MKTSFLLFALLLTLLFSCHKDKKPLPNKEEQPPVEDTPKQFSYWIVNEDSFKSNNVQAYIGMATARLECRDETNRYRIGFSLNHLPISGQFEISYIENSVNAGMDFYYNEVFYTISPNQISFLSASLVNNKGQYTLPPTWFINYDNHSDSVLIQGIFNEP